MWNKRIKICFRRKTAISHTLRDVHRTNTSYDRLRIGKRVWNLARIIPHAHRALGRRTVSSASFGIGQWIRTRASGKLSMGSPFIYSTIPIRFGDRGDIYLQWTRIELLLLWTHYRRFLFWLMHLIKFAGERPVLSILRNKLSRIDDVHNTCTFSLSASLSSSIQLMLLLSIKRISWLLRSAQSKYWEKCRT